MSAPTKAEIRAAGLQQWNRRRDDDVAPWAPQPLSGRLVDTARADLFVDVGRVLYDRSDEDGLEGPLDLIEREIMEPIMAECERRILDGMVAVFERFAREDPDAPRRADHPRVEAA